MMLSYQGYTRLISFASVHQAVKAEKLLTQSGIPAYALPTPREIDISCGQCLLFAAEQELVILDRLAASRVCWSKLFSRTLAGDNVYVYEKITEYGGKRWNNC